MVVSENVSRKSELSLEARYSSRMEKVLLWDISDSEKN